MNEPLHVERRGAAVWLTLNRPAHGNTIDAALACALLGAVEDCHHDDACRCLVIRGEGRLFCGGGDVTTFAAGGDTAAAIDSITGPLHSAIERLMALDKPIVTLVNGAAAGAGLGLAILGDIVLAARSASFSSAYTALGVTPDGGTSWFLPRLIGLRRAQEMVLTNRRISAEEAERIGLVTRMVEDDVLVDEGKAMSEALAASAIGALAQARRLLSDGLGRTLHDHLEVEARAIAANAAGPEGAEGIAAFLGRRAPEFHRNSRL